MAKLLYVEDDRELSAFVVALLQNAHFTVEHCVDGNEGLERALCSDFAAIILDIELPGMDGIEICREIRQSDYRTPILMLTNRGQIDERVEGLDIGADDYLPKPFGVQELLARIRALLRRSAGLGSNIVEFDRLHLDLNLGIISCEQKPLDLNQREYSLLEFLMRHPQEVFSHDVLLNNVWESDASQSSDAVRMCVTRLRKKIDDPHSTRSFIQTVHRVGYKLDYPD